MSRYIDFYLIGELVDSHGNVHYEDLKNLPTADVVEVKHGEWSLNIDDWFGDCYKCSACGEEFVLNDGTPKDYEYNYCPNCGAKMKGEENVF